MPYIRRDDRGNIVAMSAVAADGFDEEIAEDSPELGQFFAEQQTVDSLDATDQGFIRVLEDVVELMVEKGLILFTELPQSAQQKIMRRQELRSEMSGKLDLIGDD